jgi:hypothetical protein
MRPSADLQHLPSRLVLNTIRCRAPRHTYACPPPPPPLTPPPPLVRLSRCPGLSSAPGGQEWWEAEFDLPAQLFRIDFVVLDQNTGGVDNNKAKVRHW